MDIMSSASSVDSRGMPLRQAPRDFNFVLTDDSSALKCARMTNRANNTLGAIVNQAVKKLGISSDDYPGVMVKVLTSTGSCLIGLSPNTPRSTLEAMAESGSYVTYGDALLIVISKTSRFASKPSAPKASAPKASAAKPSAPKKRRVVKKKRNAGERAAADGVAEE